jgi:hypothetical protein
MPRLSLAEAEERLRGKRVTTLQSTENEQLDSPTLTIHFEEGPPLEIYWAVGGNPPTASLGDDVVVTTWEEDWPREERKDA